MKAFADERLPIPDAMLTQRRRAYHDARAAFVPDSPAAAVRVIGAAMKYIEALELRAISKGDST